MCTERNSRDDVLALGGVLALIGAALALWLLREPLAHDSLAPARAGGARSRAPRTTRQ